MNSRLIIGFAFVAVFLGAVGWYVVSQSGSNSASTDPALLLPDLAAAVEDVDSIDIETQVASLRIERSPSGWILPNKTGVAALEDKVRAILIGLSDLKGIEPKTSLPENYARIGVDDLSAENSRATRVTLRQDDGTVVGQVIVGLYAPSRATGRTRFVRRADDAQSWLVEANFDVSAVVSQWVDRTLMRIDGSRIESLVITHPDGNEFVISRPTPEEENFSVEPMRPTEQLRNPAIANPITRSLTNLMFEDVRPISEATQDPSTVSVIFETFDGLVISLHIGDEEGVRWTTVSISASGDAYDEAELASIQDRIAGRQFALPKWAATNLTKRSTDFLVEPEAAIEGVLPAIDPGG